jgi:predicted dehydrogenase
MPLKWGIIGTGTRGNFTHVSALNALASDHEHELVALCDVAEDRLLGASKRVEKASGKQAVAVYPDYQKLLAHPDLNAVVIATPNLLHREMLQAALQAGKHVLCEKPAGVSLSDAAEMQRMADAAKTVVMFGMQYRHNPKNAKVRELIEKGRIGQPKYIVQNCSRGDWNLSAGVFNYSDPKLFNGQPHNWRFFHSASGGSLNEFSCHYFDLLNWYAGAVPTAVGGDGGIAVRKDGRDTWDWASVTLTYPNGVKAVHTLSLFGTGRGDISVMGEEGTIESVGDKFHVVQVKRARGAAGKPNESGGSREQDIEVNPKRKAKGGADAAVLELYDDFTKCVKTGKKPDADATRAVAASKTCWLAERSAERRAEVKWDDAMARS